MVCGKDEEAETRKEENPANHAWHKELLWSYVEHVTNKSSADQKDDND
jgi:hypothetical protein